MKPRAIFLAFALPLLIVPLASADQASGPAASEIRAAIFSDPASPDCEDEELAWLEPARQERSILCGSCSQPLCVGKQWGQFCKYQGGRYYYCQPAYVVCDPDDCQCWTGPLP